MKVYLYYLTDHDILMSLKIHNLLEALVKPSDDVEFPFCYAHTTDKNIAKLFRKTRNMSVFREVIRKINKEDVELFPSDYYRDLKEISIYFGSDHRMVLPLTRTEYWALENSSEVFHDIMWKMNWPPINIFEDGIGQILDVMTYGIISNSNYRGTYDFDSPENLAITHNSWTNEFGMLLIFFHQLFNAKKCLEKAVVIDENDEGKGSISSVCGYK